MRKRPNIEVLKNNFIDAATTNVEDIRDKPVIKNTATDIDYNEYVSNLIWPLDKDEIAPSYAEGCLLKKPLSINFNEKEWNTIDRHIKALGVSKDKWVKRTLLKQLYIEQIAAFNGRNKQKV